MKKKQDYTPNGWSDGEKRPYNNVKVNRQIRRSKDLSAGAKLVMEELVDSGASKGKSWPKLATLATAVAQNKTTAWRHIQELEKLGYLIVERRHSTSCLYTLGPRLDSIAPKNTFKPVDKTIDVCMDANVTYAPTYTLTCAGAHTTSYAQTHVSILSKELIIPENQDAEKTISSEQNKEENKIKTNHSDTRSIKGILSEVLEFTGDNKNRGNWIQKCVSIPEDEIRAAMIQTEKAKDVRNKGAYLNHILNSKAQAEPSFSDIMPPYVGPEQEGPRASEEQKQHAMNEIKKILDRPRIASC